ncbi:MAG: RNA ligase family protein [Pseudomonas sp.]|uniref:RNA ligase family protein n=1 Tax=Pseudomonas sp. TaxID=306 RepID=UPI00339AB546
MSINRCAYAQNLELIKYPRTPHLQGSRLQPGDSEAGQVAYHRLAGRWLVVEEKLDGANCAISFSSAAELLLQSRGHYLSGGGRERQFNLLKQWAVAHEPWLLERLEDRYVLYGEWLHKKHAVFYDQLPHYFCEFDIWDRQAGCFLSTVRRHALLADGPVLSVPVLFAGVAPGSLRELLALVGPSGAKSPAWQAGFETQVRREGLDVARAWRQCDRSIRMEGLYLKLESPATTDGRIKWVRQDFIQAIEQAGQHHAEQPFIANQLAPGVDLYAPRLTHRWAPTGGGQ